MNTRAPWLGVLLFAATAAATTLSGCAQAAPSAGTSFYINFDHGDDSRDGQSAATAWRHAPGDANAQGRAGATKLSPGDTLLFASGVRYRGEVRLNGGGLPGSPVVLTSDGDAPAVIDGSDRAESIRPCKSAEDCGGAPNWHQLQRVDFARPMPPGVALFTEVGALYPAQSPNPKAIFYSDDVKEYYEVSGADLEQGIAKLPKEVARAIAGAGEKQLALWTFGNLIKVRDITSLEGSVARFDPSGLKFYTDRPDRVAVLAHPSLIDRAGEYAFVADRRAAAVFMPEGAKNVSTAAGRGGININGMSNVTIRHLGFANMADDGASVRSGIAITSQGKSAAAIRIDGNVFQHFWMPKGQGPITLRKIDDLTITGNQIRSVALGSGMRVSQSTNVKILDNSISSMNRTGIMLMGVENGLVARNTISDAKGVHGNGMSVYLGNRNVRVVANTVTDATRPMTFHGDGTGATMNDMVVANNLFIGTPESSAALTSWGKTMRGITVRSNVLLGGKFGLRLAQTDREVLVEGNTLNGIAFIKPQPGAWRFIDNLQVRYSPQARSSGARNFEKSVANAILGVEPPPSDLCLMFAGSAGRAPIDKEFAGAVGARTRCPIATGG
jgi:parallel beta-helix repeat protein